MPTRADPQPAWESKLVAWLLHLRTHAQPGSLWRAYCDALPSALDTPTFYLFDAAAAEQLQLGSWKVRGAVLHCAACVNACCLPASAALLAAVAGAT